MSTMMIPLNSAQSMGPRLADLQNLFNRLLFVLKKWPIAQIEDMANSPTTLLPPRYRPAL
jgi:hypothetical protein